MIDLYGVLQEQETVNGELGLGVDYYKGEPGAQGIPGKDGSDQVYVGADEPTDERVKLWIDTDATPSSKAVSWDEIENKPEIPAPYTLPTASTSTLGGVKVDGSTITIADGVISSVGGSGSTEPNAYIKDASVSGNTLTLTKKDDTEVVFTPSGGSSDIKSYSFSAGSLTAEEIANLQYCVDNPMKVIFTIDNIKIQNAYKQGIWWYFIGIFCNGDSRLSTYYIKAAENSTTIIGTSLSKQYSYNVIITQSNINSYVSSWNAAESLENTGLYNAKELAILFENDETNVCYSSYYNFSCSFDSIWDSGGLGMYANKNFYIQISNNEYSNWYYDGSQIHFSGNMPTNYRIYYKT